MSELPPQNLPSAIVAWQALLGNEHVLTQDSDLMPFQTATFSTQSQVLAVIRPKNSQQVSEAMKVANQYKIPIYPISTGQNWGYGSSVPPGDNNVIMQLSGMHAISDFSEELAHITIEPGVTQQQLYQFLQTNNSSLWMDATGSSPQCSIIGNTMERGFGHTPYGDHFNHVCSLEVVLPTGEIIHTGFSKFDNAHAHKTYKWGVGSYIDGLFTQSNLGIVTKLTLWLMPAPEYFQAFYIMIEDDSELEDLIETLRPLRLNGTIKSTVHIGNDYKVLSSVARFPWHLTDGQAKLDQAIVNQLAKEWDFGAWNVSGALYGTKLEVKSAREKITAAFKHKVKRIRFLDDNMLGLAQKFQHPYKWLTKLDLPQLLKVMVPVHGLKKGIPTPDIIASTFWRKTQPVPRQPHPDRDRCGLIWCAPVAPTTGEHARNMVNIIEQTVAKYGFEPLISMSMINERSLDNVISIIYDRDIEGQDELAQQCHQELLTRFSQDGYFPYRLSIDAMNILQQTEPSYLVLQAKIKQALDPNNILAPGRYEVDNNKSPTR